MKRKLVLENGKTFVGEAFGSLNEVVAEITFNTAVVGYQEMISDPANANKMICMTYPLIGNYGLADEDYESKNTFAKGLIVREYNDSPSNFRYTRTLAEVMEENNVSGISEIDTRELTKVIRTEGSMKAIIADLDKPLEECLEIIKNTNVNEGLASKVSSKRIWHSRTANPSYTVALIDIGTKLSIVKNLNTLGCNVIVYPYNTSVEEILKNKPNGIVISSGLEVENAEVINLINQLKGQLPILGIGYGHTLLGMSYGLKPVKMLFGQNGLNHPTKNTVNGRVYGRNHAHQYAFKNSEFNFPKLKVLEYGLVEDVVESIVDETNLTVGVQYYPDLLSVDNAYSIFVKNMNLKKGEARNAKKNRS